MPKLLNIKGYWTENSISDFNEYDIWEGKMILQDDGWFEGIARDPNDRTYTGDRFIFGVYYPGKTIELFKFCPLAINSPFVYHADTNGEDYSGDTQVLGETDLFPFGKSLIKASEFTSEMGNIDEVKKDLEEDIAEYKKWKMDAESVRVFYERIHKIRGSIGKLCLLELKKTLVSYTDKEELTTAFVENYDSIHSYLVNAVIAKYRRKVLRLILDYDTLPPDNGLPFEI